MALLIWNEAFSVGIPSIDEQHKELMNLLNEVANAKIEGTSRKEIEKILKGIIDFTINHFGYEEKLMKQISYEREDIHKKEHADITNQANDYLARFKEFKLGEAGVYDAFMDDLLNFLKKFMMNHILGEDKRYSKPMQNAGIK